MQTLSFMAVCRFTEQKGKKDRLRTTHAATSDNSECNCRWKKCAIHSAFIKDGKNV